jgi:transposase
MKLAREIRASALEGKSNREIAKAFGIGKSAVSEVIRNETWKEAQ